MFKQVSHMNEVFGNQKGDYKNTDWVKLNNQCLNILDEYNELIDDGIKPRNIKEVRDALCDILVFTLGAYHMIGYDAEKDMTEVYNSNMSKICSTQKELDETTKYYEDLDIKVYSRVKYNTSITLQGVFEFGVVYSSIDQSDKNGKVYRANKFLKSVNWSEPVFK